MGPDKTQKYIPAAPRCSWNIFRVASQHPTWLLYQKISRQKLPYHTNLWYTTSIFILFRLEVARQNRQKTPQQHLAATQYFQHIFLTPKMNSQANKIPAKNSAS